MSPNLNAANPTITQIKSHNERRISFCATFLAVVIINFRCPLRTQLHALKFTRLLKVLQFRRLSPNHPADHRKVDINLLFDCRLWRLLIVCLEAGLEDQNH